MTMTGRLWLYTSVVASGFLYSGANAQNCSVEDPLPSIADVACSTNTFSIICSLVETAGLESSLSEGGPITIFLPNDEAFGNLGQDLVDLLTANENRIILEEVLLNHVVASETVVLSADLECDGTVPMLSGETSSTICVTEDIFQIGLGNIALNQDDELLPQVVATDTVACNGVVHEVNNVILPQSVADLVDGVDGDDDDDENDSPDMVEPECSPNLVDIACDDDDFSILCDVLQATGLDRVLTQDGPFTAFAPVDDAFLELGQSALDALLEEDGLVTLTDILLYHVVLDEEIFSDDLLCLGKLEMANGEETRTICHRRSNRIFQMGSGNSFRNYPEIVVPDIEACNGVAHVIDRVILQRLDDASTPGSRKTGKSAKSSKSAKNTKSVKSKSSKSDSSKSSKKKKVKRTKKWSK